MKPLSVVKLFTLNNVSIETDLQKIQEDLNLDIGKAKKAKNKNDNTYYPQFSERLKKEASSMAYHYEIFYCLENSIRQIISERLSEEFGNTWWGTTAVPEQVKQNAKKNRDREMKDGVTLRSQEMITYTTFGELGEIIKANWNIFSDTFKNLQAIEAIISRLNGVRAPIAHCCPLAEDEILRLELAMRDFFRQMG